MSALDIAAELAARLGLRQHARSWTSNCPCCSCHDAFAIKVRGGSERPLLFRANCCTRQPLHAAADQAFPVGRKPEPGAGAAEIGKARESKRATALQLRNGSGSCAGTLVAKHLVFCALAHISGSAALRFRSDCWHAARARLLALIANVQDIEGKTLSVHRTYLSPAGHKASVTPVKASLGPVWGGASHLHDAQPELVVGEGIETTSSAGALLDLPAWAAVSAGNLAAAMALPRNVRKVVIAIDPDIPSQKAARQAAARWRAEERQVRLAVSDHHTLDFNNSFGQRARG